MGQRDHFRATARRKLQIPVVLRSRGSTWDCEARMVDLGLGGTCVELPEFVPADTDLIVEIHTPTLWDPLVLRASIAWMAPCESIGKVLAGIAFRHREPNSLMALFDLLGAHGFDP